jgi:hypothetical protein
LIVFFISVESGNCNVHSANVSATIICTKLAGLRTAVLSMTVPHTVSESTDSHEQAQASLGPRKPKLSSLLILLGLVHRLKRVRIALADEIPQSSGSVYPCEQTLLQTQRFLVVVYIPHTLSFSHVLNGTHPMNIEFT